MKAAELKALIKQWKELTESDQNAVLAPLRDEVARIDKRLSILKLQEANDVLIHELGAIKNHTTVVISLLIGFRLKG